MKLLELRLIAELFVLVFFFVGVVEFKKLFVESNFCNVKNVNSFKIVI